MNDLIGLACDPKRPAPGSPYARRLALISRYYEPARSLIAGGTAIIFVGAVFFEILLSPGALTLTGAWLAFMGAGSLACADQVSGAEDYALTLPVSRKEAFWTRFLPGFLLLFAAQALCLIAGALEIPQALWSLVAAGPLTRANTEYPAGLTLLALFAPGFAYSAVFLVQTLRLSKLWQGLATGAIFAAFIVGLTTLMSSTPNKVEALMALAFAAVLAGLTATFARLACRAYERTELAPGREGGGTKTLELLRRRLPQPFASAHQKPPLRPVTPYTPGKRHRTPGGSVAARRTALLFFTYAPLRKTLMIVTPIAAIAMAIFPVKVQVVPALALAYVLSAWINVHWNKADGREEFALMLPVRREELFWARVLPPLTYLFSLGLLSLFASEAFGISKLLWSHESESPLAGITMLFGPSAIFSVICVMPMATPKMAMFSWMFIYPLLFGWRTLESLAPEELALVCLAVISVALALAYTMFRSKEAVTVIRPTNAT